MKSKLDLAHDYAMAFIREALKDDIESDFNHNLIAINSWSYADAMYEQLEKRDIKSNDELKNNLMSQINKEYASDLEELNQHRRNAEWQPDWSQAPDWAVWWSITKSGKGHWFSSKPAVKEDSWVRSSRACRTSPSFSYQGHWTNSLRERP